MKIRITIKFFTLMMLVNLNAFAIPCFHQGKYQGMGFWKGEGEVQSAYSVTSDIIDQNNVKSSYNWQPDQAVSYELKIVSTDVFLNGNDRPSGSAECSLGEAKIIMKGAYGDSSLEVKEEWVFVGNYLLRHGEKLIGTEKVSYQELLIRRE